MREFETRLVESFNNGLSPSPRLGVNTPYLSVCQNMKPTVEGLVSHDAVQQAVSDLAINFPFPQLFKGQSVILLADATKLYTVNETSWLKSQLTISGSITSGGAWHFVDLFDYWILFNGSSVVYKSNKYMLDGSEPIIVALDSPTIQTGCYLNGRVILGGFGDDFWSDPKWQHIIEEWQESLTSGVSITPEMRQNFVLWSSIGGGDALWFLDPEDAVKGINFGDASTASGPKIFESLRRNEMGFMPMPWQGTVRLTKPLGDAVVVYGDDGISAIVQVLEPTPTFGLKHIANFGIAGRGAVSGSASEHIFVDKSGYVWRMGLDFVPKRLDYHSHIQNLTAEDIVMSYDPGPDEHYISDGGSLTYVLTPKGLGSVEQYVTSIILSNGSLLGVMRNSGTGAVTVTTEPIDFGIRGLKTLAAVEIGIESDEDATVNVQILVRYNKDQSFTTIPSVPANKEGTAYVNVTGLEFKIAVTVSTYDSTLPKITYMNLRWKLSDKRMIRGIYATSTPT